MNFTLVVGLWPFHFFSFDSSPHFNVGASLAEFCDRRVGTVSSLQFQLFEGLQLRQQAQASIRNRRVADIQTFDFLSFSHEGFQRLRLPGNCAMRRTRDSGGREDDLNEPGRSVVEL